MFIRNTYSAIKETSKGGKMSAAFLDCFYNKEALVGDESSTARHGNTLDTSICLPVSPMYYLLTYSQTGVATLLGRMDNLKLFGFLAHARVFHAPGVSWGGGPAHPLGGVL